MNKFTLYVGTVCPYCKRVERFIEDNGIKNVEIKNIDQDPEARDHLIEFGGKRQVPCLMYEDKYLYESLDIIHYLKEHGDR